MRTPGRKTYCRHFLSITIHKPKKHKTAGHLLMKVCLLYNLQKRWVHFELNVEILHLWVCKCYKRTKRRCFSVLKIDENVWIGKGVFKRQELLQKMRNSLWLKFKNKISVGLNLIKKSFYYYLLWTLNFLKLKCDWNRVKLIMVNSKNTYICMLEI